MPYDFQQMAAHLHECLNEIALSAPERQRVARIIGPSSHHALERVWTRYNCFLELRNLLVELAPREALVRTFTVQASNTALAA
jgi:hypothetical protein